MVRHVALAPDQPEHVPDVVASRLLAPGRVERIVRERRVPIEEKVKLSFPFDAGRGVGTREVDPAEPGPVRVPVNAAFNVLLDVFTYGHRGCVSVASPAFLGIFLIILIRSQAPVQSRKRFLMMIQEKTKRKALPSAMLWGALAPPWPRVVFTLSPGVVCPLSAG